MKLKKIVAILACIGILLSLGACKNKGTTEPTVTIKPIETAPQKNYSPDEIKDIYNTAVQKIIDAKSYHMHGSYSSTAVFGDVMTSVVNTLDLTYEVRESGPVGYFDVQMNQEGREIPHTTYHDGEHYYFDAYNWKYYTASNDYTDYYAQDYLKLIGDSELKELSFMDQLDGSLELSFSVPMGEYKSEGILGLIGEFTSENVEQDMVTVSATIDAEGTLTYFYVSFTSELDILGEASEQTIILSLSMDGYDSTVVETPDLALYENNVTDPDEFEDEHEHVGILSPEDVD